MISEDWRGLSARPANRSAQGDLAFAIALFFVAFVPRLIVARAFAREAVWDGHYYDFGARRIAQGFGYSDDRSVGGASIWHPWCHYPVGYSAFLAVFYRLFGASRFAAGLANSLVGASQAVVTWGLARHALTAARARLAGCLVALWPGLVLYAAVVMSEPLAATLTLASFWLAVRDERPARGLVLGALVLGIGALVRPQALLCAPLLAWVVPAASGQDVLVRLRSRAVAAAAACVIALVPVLPWTLRNCLVMDGCALVSTNAGWNLAIGAFPRATGRFETLRASDGCRDVTGQVQQDRCWFAYGLAQIAAHPLRWAALVPAKLGYTFDHESFAVEYLHEAAPESWPDTLRSAARDATSLFHRCLLAAAALGGVALPLGRRGQPAPLAQGMLLTAATALGLWAFATQTPVFWPLALFAAMVPLLPIAGRPQTSPALLLSVGLLATTILAHAIFFGEDRYHIVVTPVLAVLAAGALRRTARPARVSA